MNDPTELSHNLIQRLDYYVYIYTNPLDNTIFYVGRGTGNRVLSHLNDESESDKVKKIKEIRAAGKGPRMEILRHGLDKETAIKIEASVIDAIGIPPLTNEIRGSDTDHGRMGLELLGAIVDPHDAGIEEPSILIRINQLYRYGMSDVALYEATCGIWVVGERRYKAKYAFAIYAGIVLEVYFIKQWFPAGSSHYTTRPELNDPYRKYDPPRWEFVGELAESEIREKYRLKSVKKYLSTDSQNPIKYIEC